MRINTNIAALNAHRSLGNTNAMVSRTLGRLSSGFRINRAADDAAGLGIANRLRADVRSLRQAARNAEQSVSLLQVAEGATQTVQSIVERMKELATQAASDNTDASGRGRIDTEFQALRAEIQRVVSTTKFQGKSLLDGTFGNSVDEAGSTALTTLTSGLYGVQLSGTAAGTYTFAAAAGVDSELTLSDGTNSQTVSTSQDGKQTLTFDQFGITIDLSQAYTYADGTNADSLDGLTIVVQQGAGGGSFMVGSSGAYTSNDLVSLASLDVSVTTLGIDGANGDLSTAAAAQATLSNIDGALGSVAAVLGEIGAAQNRIDYASQNVNITIENFSAAESVIRDADFAAEMTEFTKYQILQQAGVAMLAQANAAPQAILSLLR